MPHSVTRAYHDSTGSQEITLTRQETEIEYSQTKSFRSDLVEQGALGFLSQLTIPVIAGVLSLSSRRRFYLISAKLPNLLKLASNGDEAKSLRS